MRKNGIFTGKFDIRTMLRTMLLSRWKEVRVRACIDSERVVSYIVASKHLLGLSLPLHILECQKLKKFDFSRRM